MTQHMEYDRDHGTRYVGVWYGGSNYAAPDPDRDLEPFDSIRQAGRVLQARDGNDDGTTPCSERGEIHLYRRAYHDQGPDVVLTLGPRGGIRRE